MSGGATSAVEIRMDSVGGGPGADVVAAGAVLWRPAAEYPQNTGDTDGAVEVAVVHRPRYDDWSLPKGKSRPGEPTPVAAVREVAEETGFTAVLGVRLGESRYPVPQGEKVVHYWSAKAEANAAGGFAPNAEVDQLRWLAPAQAAGLLSYPRDQVVVGRFRALAPSGRPPRPLLLVRHAKAGSRARWPGDDDERPLSGPGRRQAKDLVGLLRLFGPARAYAAPPVRCAHTIRPLTERLGLEIGTEPLLGDHDYGEDPDAGLARLLELAKGPGVAVVCGQGGMIPDVLERLTGRPKPPARKASTWVLGFAADRVATADHYPAP